MEILTTIWNPFDWGAILMTYMIAAVLIIFGLVLVIVVRRLWAVVVGGIVALGGIGLLMEWWSL